MAISSRLCPVADYWAVIAGVGVDIPTYHLHPGNPENNFLEHQGSSPQMNCAEKGWLALSPPKSMTQSNTSQAIVA